MAICNNFLYKRSRRYFKSRCKSGNVVLISMSFKYPDQAHCYYDRLKGGQF